MQFYPTPYTDINEVLNFFLKEIKNILGKNFIGMYLYGSLATGDFDLSTSDIDFIVITHADISDESYLSLYNLHDQYLLSNSPWAQKIEAAYIAQSAFGKYKIDALFPQAEKGKKLTKEKLEIGWAFQCYALREHGIVIEGPAPQVLFDAVQHDDMITSAISIIKLWCEQAHDEKEVEWLKQRDEQAFVVLTLCRFLHLLNTKTITSKHMSGRWALSNLDKKWHHLISQAMNKKIYDATVSDVDMQLTVDFIDYVASFITIKTNNGLF